MSSECAEYAVFSWIGRHAQGVRVKVPAGLLTFASNERMIRNKTDQVTSERKQSLWVVLK